MGSHEEEVTGGLSMLAARSMWASSKHTAGRVSGGGCSTLGPEACQGFQGQPGLPPRAKLRDFQCKG